MNHNKLLLFKNIEEKRSRLTYLVVIASFILLFCFSFTSAFNFASSSVSVTTFTGNLTNLSEMQDVNIPTPTDAYVLTYDSASGKWIASLPSAGAELDPKWTGNLTNFSTIYAYAINDTNYNASGLIRDWNSSGYIKDWNSSGYIKNWWIDIVNGTVGGITWANVINGTLLKASDWNATNTSYYLNTNPYNFWNTTSATFNKTYADTLYASISVTGDNSSWNQSLANTLYYGISNPSSFWNNTYATFNKTYADTLYYGLSNPYSYYNSTNPSPTYNATYNAYNSTGLIKDWNSTGYIQNWSAIITSGGITWANVINGTMLKASDWNATNISYILWSNIVNGTMATWAQVMNGTVSGGGITWANAVNGTLALASSIPTNNNQLTNGFSYYNVTTAPIYLNDTFAGNYSTFLTHVTWANVINGTVGGGITWNNVINGTMLKASDWNATNTSYYLNTNPYNFWNTTSATFNKTYADTLYYGLSNPYSYYNSTNPSPTYNATYNAYNSTGLIKDWNSSGYIKNWWVDITNGTINGITWANAVNGTLALASSIPTNNNQLANGFSFYNVTTAPIYLNDTFRGTNYSTFLTHVTWANVINGTMMSQATYNTNYSTLTPWTSVMNGTVMAQSTYNTNYSTLLLGSTYNTNYSTLMLQSTFNTNYTTNDAIYRNQTNTSYLLKAGDSMTGSLNITTGNLSVSNRIKLAVGDCSSLVAGEICRNATAIYIQG